MNKILKRIMVFGVFDGLHEGHRYFLSEAGKYGDELTIVVARDEMVQMLKNKTPRHIEDERLTAVAQLLRLSLNSEEDPQLMDVGRVVLGDKEQGVYDVIKKYKPDIICVGHDQHALAGDLEEKMAQGEIPKMQLIWLKLHGEK